MRVIDQTDFDNIPILGRGRRSSFLRALLQLEVGQGIELEPGEWTKSYPPTRTARYVRKRHNRHFKGGRNGATGGWAFLRVR